ncbi:hypothetical protein E0Z10_g3865 [Xylaria hypoxylon]|uniref:Transcription factor domain-containing protein n=1 Tax=Xylaria hypoxylon TaxID=37992 RepID=A0A4Z0Z284_9PEZI|nr:hypothetical protein E0Z10_g3865 [Xylaria hypoxylon]
MQSSTTLFELRISQRSLSFSHPTLENPESSNPRESIVLPENAAAENLSDEGITFTPHPEDASQYRDLDLLENIGVREDSLISTLSNDLAFTICSVDDILASLSDLHHVSLTYEGHPSKTIITLPTYKTAVFLFDCFEVNVDHMCRILNLPTVRSLMKSFYTRINQNESVLPGQAALLLSLFALSAFFCHPTGNTELADIGNDSTRFSKYWSRGALDVLEHSRRNTSGTLEDVQALILMSTQSTMSGPQEGTYFIHPNHIQVNFPKDYDDETGFLGDGNDSITGPQPTGLTFLLARIRLAHLSREYTDTVPLETSKLMRVPYEHIIALDQKLKEFFTELPYFFRLDKQSRQKSKHLEAVLHQKFLIRMSSDPRYDYSRQACLESARAVIRLYEEPKEEGHSPSMEMARMAMAVHYTHLALVIQVMDLCFNKNEADHEEREKEVLTTLQMLEGPRAISPLLNRSLDSVVVVLRKHQVYLSEALASHNPQGIAQEGHEGNPHTVETFQLDLPQHDMDIGEGTFVTPSINEFWQSANEFEMEFDSATWDSLFSTLDSRPF